MNVIAVLWLRQLKRYVRSRARIVGALGQVLALSGRPEQARECLRKLEQMSRSRHVQSAAFAILHLGLGEIDQALRWLERGCDQHELPVTGLKVHPVYDPLRREPAFQSLLQHIGFIE